MKDFKWRIRVAAAAILAIVWSEVAAQQIDRERMNRDIEIAEQILYSMMKEAHVDRAFLSEPSGVYVPDYGVLFTIQELSYPMDLIEAQGFNFDLDFDMDDYFFFVQIDDDTVEVKANETINRYIQANLPKEEITKENQGLKKKEQEEKMPKAVFRTPSKIMSASDHYKQVMTNFLADYSGLIAQLKPEEKVMIASSPPSSWWPSRWHNTGYYAREMMSTELSSRDIEEHKKGSISRGELVKKIKFIQSLKFQTTDDERNAYRDSYRDLALLASIFNRLYQMDMAETYFMESGISYQRIEGFGVIFNMKVYSSKKEYYNGHFLPTQGKKNLTQEERDEEVASLYPQFEQNLKENILEYGRAIKSLKPDDMILFMVELTECKGCDIPKRLEVSVKQSVLTSYTQGKMSKEAAFNKLQLRKS